MASKCSILLLTSTVKRHKKQCNANNANKNRHMNAMQ